MNVIGQHAGPVKGIASFKHPAGTSVVVSGGWDSRVKFWTWQTPAQLNQIGEAYVAMPVHFMSLQWPLLVTAHQERLIHTWDLEKTFMS